MNRVIFLVLVCVSFASCIGQNCDYDERLKNRFSGADVVVIGEFGIIEKYLLLPEKQKADWRVATFHVQQVLKGSIDVFNQAWTQIYFPNSWDDGWGNSPKFSTSQKGILALRNVNKSIDLYEYDHDAKTALDFYDFQPLSELEYIKNLLAVR